MHSHASPIGQRFRLSTLTASHRQNRVDCLKSRARPVANVAMGARTAQGCQRGNIGHWLCRPLRWNPAKAELLGDTEANQPCSRENRALWNKV